MGRETPAEKYLRMTTVERELGGAGIGSIAGIDEVGRGPLAGPVVAACVIMPLEPPVLGVDDSKKLSAPRREALCGQILELALYAGYGWVSPARIDEINILRATCQAMEESAAGAEGAYFLVDAMEGLSLPGECRSIIHGDALSYSIAAASIAAKVARDRYMDELAEKYPEYGFERNKGYGTAEHIRALERFGPCPEHRATFIKKWVGRE